MEKREQVAQDVFVKAICEAHTNGQTLTDVAAKLGLQVPSVYQRYAKIRKMGGKLPDVPQAPKATRKARGMSVDAINALITETLPTETEAKSE